MPLSLFCVAGLKAGGGVLGPFNKPKATKTLSLFLPRHHRSWARKKQSHFLFDSSNFFCGPSCQKNPGCFFRALFLCARAYFSSYFLFFSFSRRIFSQKKPFSLSSYVKGCRLTRFFFRRLHSEIKFHLISNSFFPPPVFCFFVGFPRFQFLFFSF